MALTLRVTSFQSQALGEHATKTFGAEGGTIGRSQNNSWVLPDPEKFVSGLHAEITCRNGTYYLRDRSTNGTFLNGSPQPIGDGMEHSLAEGDQVQIGEYDIVVSLNEMDAAVLTGPTGFNFAPQRTAEGVSGRGWTGTTGSRATTGSSLTGGLGTADPGQSSSVDPLDLFDVHAEPAPAGWNGDAAAVHNHASALDDFYRPPEVEQTPPDDVFSATAAGIPEDWDRTSYAQSSQAPLDARHPGSDAPAVGFGLGEPAPLAPQAPPSAPAQAMPHPVAGDRDPVVAILTAAGFDPATARAAAASPELPAVLGSMLGVVVQGMLDVLKARTEIKSQFRVPVTMMRPVENNPLKFSANAQQALQTLLVARNPAYLGGVDALVEGFRDLKAHQIAMIAGIRAAFDSMIERFDPDELGQRFERRAKRGALIGISGKGRFWEMYRDLYEEWTQDADVNFQRLFGEKFARAYEEQMRRMTMPGRTR